ncbi:hypothetical protein CCP3SC5AM1_70007 [Gammaproteobacteria bacterium]
MVHKGAVWGIALMAGLITAMGSKKSHAWWPSPWESWWLDNPWFDSPLGGGFPGLRDYGGRRRRAAGDEPWESLGYRDRYRGRDSSDYYPGGSSHWDSADHGRSYGNRGYDRGEKGYYGEDWGRRDYDYGRAYDYGYEQPSGEYGYRYGYDPSTGNDRGGYYYGHEGSYRGRQYDAPSSEYGNNSWDRSQTGNQWENSGWSGGDSWGDATGRPWGNTQNSSPSFTRDGKTRSW